MKLNQNLLADIFQNGMIFPLNKDFKLGGYIQPNQAVEVEFAGKRYLTKSSNNGKWCVIIPAVSDPTYVGEIAVHASKQIQIIKNIKFGHVYLLSGQSNIEYRLKDEAHYKNVISDLKNKKYSDFYYYNVPQVDYIDHENGDIKPKNLQAESWHEINENNVGMISAVGFYMMAALRENDVYGPLAVVDCFKGGTSASVWIKEDDLASDPRLKRAFLDKYHEIIDGKTWSDFDRETAAYNLRVEKHNQDLAKYLKMHPDTSLSTAKNIVGHTPWPPPYRPDLYTRPSGLNETMLKQVEFGVFNQMVWYQGENDTDRANYYYLLLPRLLHTWRRTLKDPSLPIKLIQLPGYADYPDNSGAVIRQTQMMVAQQFSQVDLVSFIDGGEEHNIHPTNKKDMGMRLGRIMAGNDYSGTPYVSKVRIKDQKLTLEIARCSQLVLKENVFLKIKYLDDSFETVRLTNKNIRKNEIVLDLKKTFLGVSYAYKNYPMHIGLYNELGYPVSPFKYEYKKKMF